MCCALFGWNAHQTSSILIVTDKYTSTGMMSSLLVEDVPFGISMQLVSYFNL